MSVPGIFKQDRVSTMSKNLHLAFKNFVLLVMVGVVEIFVLKSVCLRFGDCLYVQRVVLRNKCLAAGMLLLRFHSFIPALLVGTMVGWYVCKRDRQFFDVFCFYFKSSASGILFSLFHCFFDDLVRVGLVKQMYG